VTVPCRPADTSRSARRGGCARWRWRRAPTAAPPGSWWASSGALASWAVGGAQGATQGQMCHCATTQRLSGMRAAMAGLHALPPSQRLHLNGRRSCLRSACAACWTPPERTQQRPSAWPPAWGWRWAAAACVRVQAALATGAGLPLPMTARCSLPLCWAGQPSGGPVCTPAALPACSTSLPTLILLYCAGQDGHW
jgi:hypothetical protein